MTRLTIIFVTIALLIIFGDARHIHLKESGDAEEILNIEPRTEIEGLPIDVIRNIKPSGFVPINDILFFKTYEPCDNGFKKDILGICREVWD